MEYKLISFKDQNKEIQTFKLYDNKLLIMGDNNSGKTRLLNKLSNGFLGKDSTFHIDDKQIGFGDYQVVYLKEKMELVEEIKLIKTSDFRNKLIKSINEIILNNNKYSQTLDLIKKINDLFNFLLLETDLISNNNTLINSSLLLKSNFSNVSIEGFIDKLLKFDIYNNEELLIDATKYSSYHLRILLLNILVKYSDINDKLRPVVFIIDQPELYGTINSLWQLINDIKNLINEKSITILASNCPILYNFFIDELEQVVFLKNNKINSFEFIKSIVAKTISIYAFLDSDSCEYEVFLKDLSYVLTDEDIVFEKNKYLKNNMFFILHAINCKKLFLKISAINLFNITNDMFCLELSKENIIFVYLFLKNLDIELILENDIKIFFDKCNWLFN
ncbi:hypothetical protein SSYRP_v1c09360 [Spiroplasma syrphidicola EA-1]|uniref:AAA domain-containing protein n=1 Tax=Spiroplasma syrphidicola EA-1 TaxID=1276229 RepID=R4U792_9MOLU|nr:hypothetical protein [Spiroplasma syrphidicola]AGM26523.1 hypothetical protein SSYRP_v1c09360 [Spiroplasma syrphidicola EA-1]